MSSALRNSPLSRHVTQKEPLVAARGAMNRGVRAEQEQHSAGRTKTQSLVYSCFCMKTRRAGSTVVAERFSASRGCPFLNAIHISMHVVRVKRATLQPHRGTFSSRRSREEQRLKISRHKLPGRIFASLRCSRVVPASR